VTYLAILLAAGKSTRMNSLNKSFCEIGKEKIIIHCINTILESNPSQIIIVINHSWTDEDKKYISGFIGTRCKFDFVYQEDQLGTGDAVKTAINFCKNEKFDYSIVFYSDTPLMELFSIEKIKEKLKANQSDGVICGFFCEKKNQYGRIIINKNHLIETIHEYKDYAHNDEIQNIKTCNSGLVGINFHFMKEAIYKISNQNEAREYYLFDILKFSNKKFDYLEISEDEALGINTPQDLANLEKIWQEKQREFFLKRNVFITNPESVYFGFNNKIGQNTRIENNVNIGKNVDLGQNIVIESNVVIKNDVKIGSGTIIKSFSYISKSLIGDNCEIGPHAHINDGNIIGNANIIGNFVEIKRSIIQDKNKIKHLSYLGDASIENENNFGAGSIICNYDGKNKHKTIIGSSNMIGANTSIIAPRSIGNRNIIGAGSVLNEDLESQEVAVERSDLKIKKKAD
jgi:bifunctional UDP-N-acetylglucosamine pyrophosphorylase/glucosamine-1-phosphate N-acetyltransferase